MTLDFQIEVPDGTEVTDMHMDYRQVLTEAAELFVAKNHDYFSSWRLHDINSLARVMMVKLARVLSLLKLAREGKKSQVAEGIEMEMKDVLNYAVFGVLLHRGYEVDLLDVLSDGTSDFTEEPLDLGEEEPEADEEPTEEVAAQPKPKSKAEQQVFVVPDPLKGKRKKIAEEIGRLSRERLATGDPFPMFIRLPDENILASQKEFQFGGSPYVYVRSDVLYPDKTEEVKAAHPDETVFLRMSSGKNQETASEHFEALEKANAPKEALSMDDVQKMMGALQKI